MSDLISRQAVLKLLSTMPSEEAITKAMLIQNVKYMSSAQPEKRTEERTETHACDCISRKAAIDAIYKVAEMFPYRIPGQSKTYRQYNEAWSDACDASARAIEGLPSAQPEPRWISCSERLPEHGGRYLISVLDGINRRTTVAPYLPRCKAWTMTGRMAYWKVIAWMPLPEPYKEK